ncbi:hypothetical protein MJD09_27115 [bacterium]|nr:hypothetical protein [bacterium]
MNIKNIYGMGPPKKIERQSVEAPHGNKKIEKEQAADASVTAVNSDQVHISDEAKELHKNSDKQSVAKELLTRLPSTRAHVVYEALAKIKAGFYSSEEIVEKAAQRLIEGGELDDLIQP